MVRGSHNEILPDLDGDRQADTAFQDINSDGDLDRQVSKGICPILTGMKGPKTIPLKGGVHYIQFHRCDL